MYKNDFSFDEKTKFMLKYKRKEEFDFQKKNFQNLFLSRKEMLSWLLSLA